MAAVDDVARYFVRRMYMAVSVLPSPLLRGLFLPDERLWYSFYIPVLLPLSSSGSGLLFPLRPLRPG